MTLSTKYLLHQFLLYGKVKETYFTSVKRAQILSFLRTKSCLTEKISLQTPIFFLEILKPNRPCWPIWWISIVAKWILTKLCLSQTETNHKVHLPTLFLLSQNSLFFLWTFFFVKITFYDTKTSWCNNYRIQKNVTN